MALPASYSEIALAQRFGGSPLDYQVDAYLAGLGTASASQRTAALAAARNAISAGGGRSGVLNVAEVTALLTRTS